MEVLLLGTGAADGWPNPWCTCASCAWARRTGSVRSHTAALVDGTLLLDCGPDVPRQADRAGVGLSEVRGVLLTHGHWDHTGPAALLTRAWAGRREPLQLLGPESALQQCRQWIGPDDPVETVPLEPGDKVDVGGVQVVALAANHGVDQDRAGDGDRLAADALLYDLTTKGGHRLLYATDTAALPEPTMSAVADAAYDIVLLDETFGTVVDHGTGHLDLATFAGVVAALRANGAVTAGTDVVAVHLGHRNPIGVALDRELAAAGARAVPDLTYLLAGPRPLPDAPGPRRTLLLGGARSGKSGEAERRLAALGPEVRVRYVATASERPDDPEWAARVAAHRARRPPSWSTTQTLDVAGFLRSAATGEPVLVDCLSLWLAGTLDASGLWRYEADDAEHGRALGDVAAAIDELVVAVRDTTAHL
ncbi:MAG: bifunctional adenosylcobinamide kinase/adenosylcobinamide-phosphate guanylyltransferase, partial [Candidatus Nanopelagicales bacterium]